MGNAKDLLNSLTDAEIASYSAISAEEPHIVIGEDRIIDVPDELKRLGVQNDHNIETVTFDCPRYWDDNDLSTMTVYVQYMRSDKYIDSYIAKNLTIDETDDTIMHFDWTISKNVTSVPGELAFLICIRSTNDEGIESNAWHSELCRTTHISAGLECVDEHVIELNSDLITGMLTNVNECMKDVSEIDKKVGDIIAGNLVVKKAECDEYGNVIADTYATPESVDFQISEALSSDLHPVANSGDYNDLVNTPITVLGTPPLLNSLRETGVYIFSPNGGFEDVDDTWYSNNGLSKYGIYRITVNADTYTSPTTLVTQLIECNNSFLLRTFNFTLDDNTPFNIKETPLIINGVSVADTKIEELVSKVDEEITKIINGAPEALDTLNELAKALGDDPNFAATITTELSKKVNDSDLHPVAKSGDYNDLSNKPAIDTALSETSTNPVQNKVVAEAFKSQGIQFIDVESYDDIIAPGIYRNVHNIDTTWLIVSQRDSAEHDYTQIEITPLGGIGYRYHNPSDSTWSDWIHYSTQEEIKPKISMWKSNTHYYVDDTVIALDPDGYYYTATCKTEHISSDIESLFMGDTGYWTIKSISSKQSFSAIYAENAGRSTQAEEDADGNIITATYATKAELRPTPITDISSTIVANNSYNYGEQTELSITFPTTANDGDVVYITFTSGATATVLTLDTTNTSDIELIPETNTGYEVYAKYNGTIWIVNYSDYTVTAEAGA